MTKVRKKEHLIFQPEGKVASPSSQTNLSSTVLLLCSAINSLIFSIASRWKSSGLSWMIVVN